MVCTGESLVACREWADWAFRALVLVLRFEFAVHASRRRESGRLKPHSPASPWCVRQEALREAVRAQCTASRRASQDRRPCSSLVESTVDAGDREVRQRHRDKDRGEGGSVDRVRCASRVTFKPASNCPLGAVVHSTVLDSVFRDWTT